MPLDPWTLKNVAPPPPKFSKIFHIPSISTHSPLSALIVDNSLRERLFNTDWGRVGKKLVSHSKKIHAPPPFSRYCPPHVSIKRPLPSMNCFTTQVINYLYMHICLVMVYRLFTFRPVSIKCHVCTLIGPLNRPYTTYTMVRPLILLITWPTCLVPRDLTPLAVLFTCALLCDIMEAG